MGMPVQTKTEREVFCHVDSITRAEFFDAGREGFNPSLRFTVFFDDYDSEDTLIYNGNQYSIYRTYLKRNDDLELYAERKGGSNGNSTG